MTRDEAITLVLNRLGNRANDTVLTAQAVLELQHVQEQMELKEELPDFLLTERATASTIADEERLPVPTNFLLELEEGALFITNDDGTEIELEKDDYDVLRNKFASVAATLPTRYALRNDYFVLFPKPNKAYTVRMAYYKKDTVLSSDVTNQWLTYAPDVMINGLGEVLAGEYLHNAALRDRFAARGSGAVRRMYNRDTALKEANKKRNMGDGP